MGRLQGVTIASVLTIASSLVIAVGCSRYVFDVEVDLKTSTYRADFGSATGAPLTRNDPVE